MGSVEERVGGVGWGGTEGAGEVGWPGRGEGRRGFGEGGHIRGRCCCIYWG